MDTIAKWGEYLAVERRYSPLTVRAYKDDLCAFAKYILTDVENGKFDPSDVKFSDMRSYVMFLTERGDNPKSINRHVSALKSYFKYMVRSGVVDKDPTLKLRTMPQQTVLPEFVTAKTAEELLGRLMEWTDDPIERRNALIVIMLMTTGMRRAELTSLRREYVDTEQQKIRVMGKGGKEREIPLLPQVSDLLEQYLQNSACKSDEKYLFLSKKCEPISVDEVYRVVRETLKRAGAQGKQSPHVLRHTFATHLMAGGASIRSIQELLGHASLSSTEIYTHNTIERLKESYQKAHPRDKKL